MVAQGIHPGLGMDQYHAWKLDKSNLAAGPISCSMLKDFAPNPYAWLRTPDRQQTAAMSKGRLFDLALTDAANLGDSVIINPYDSFRSKAAQEWRDQAVAEGLLIVEADDLEQAQKAVKRVRSHAVAAEILDGCEYQVGVIGSIQGIPAKCLIDILPASNGNWGETIVDYKTTSAGLDDDSIRRTIGNFKYHWQAAFYLNLFDKTDPDRVATEFAFIFQDTVTLEVRVVKLAADALMSGTRAVKQAVAEFIRCSQHGIKSRYAKRVDDLDLLPYHAAEDETLVESMQPVGSTIAEVRLA
jgi:hypothetical protein